MLNQILHSFFCFDKIYVSRHLVSTSELFGPCSLWWSEVFPPNNYKRQLDNNQVYNFFFANLSIYNSLGKTGVTKTDKFSENWLSPPPYFWRETILRNGGKTLTLQYRKICNISFLNENDPPPHLFRKFIHFGDSRLPFKGRMISWQKCVCSL